MAELAMLATDSGRLNRKVVTHPASSLAQDRESSLAKTSVLTTMLRRLPTYLSIHPSIYLHVYLKSPDYDEVSAGAQQGRLTMSLCKGLVK